MLEAWLKLLSRRLKRVFLLQCLWNDGRLQWRLFNGVGKLYVSLQLYCWAILLGYLWWQRTKATKTSTKFQFLLFIWKTNSVTYHFYFFFRKFPKFLNFSDSMENIYLVELNVFKENAIYGLQKILLDNFPQNFCIWSAIANGVCMQKIKVGHRAKYRARNKYFLQILFPVCVILRKI